MTESTEVGNSAASRSVTDGSEAPVPARLGRYVIVDRVGAGGMGVVYSAYDPELDRRVAIKLLKSTSNDIELRARLQREARSMARLTDKNVVAVYDAGEHDGQVFIAMEFVRGQTLHAWIDAGPRPWTETVSLFAQAGRGLAAAHAAGIVHRDFKPDNVLIDEHQRAKVTDFGLARANAHPSEDPSHGAEGVPSAKTSALVTEHGALLGTPSYMSPEQFRGREVDARSDQFSFCVALWEGLYGDRPFEGDNVVDLAINVLAGNVRNTARPPTGVPSPSRGGSAPAWLTRVLRRGLSAEASARYPTMHDLLAELGRDPVRARRWWTAGITAAVVASASAAAVHVHRIRAVAACRGDAHEQLAAYDLIEKDKIATALRSTGSPFGEQTWTHLGIRLDAYATSWRETAGQTCVDTRVDKTRDAASYEGTLDCLEEARDSFLAFIEVLETADKEVVREALTIAWRLPEPSQCAEAALMSRRRLPPSDLVGRAELAAVRRGLADARAEHAAGRYGSAVEQLEMRLEEAKALGWTPLHVDILIELGFVQMLRSAHEPAAVSLEAAFLEAARDGWDDLAADAAINLVNLEAKQYRTEQAGTWLRLAETMIVRNDDENPLRQTRFLNARAGLLLRDGAPLRALEDARLGRQLLEEMFGSDHVRVASALGNEAQLLETLQDTSAGLEAARRALEIQEAAFGSEHPAIAGTLGRLGRLLSQKGDFVEAELALGQALEMQERTYGADHLSVAASLNDMGNLYGRQGKLELARGEHERALAIRRRLLGDDNPQLAASWHNLAVLDELRQDFDRALSGYERAHELYEHALGPDNVDLAPSLTGIGNAHAGKGDYAKAMPFYARALAIREAAAAPSVSLGETRIAMARAMWELGDDRPGAIVLARQARRDYEAGGTEARMLAEIDAWLGKHPMQAATPD